LALKPGAEKEKCLQQMIIPAYALDPFLPVQIKHIDRPWNK
jgi:hypothetical protein